jgi:L-fuconolactonase
MVDVVDTHVHVWDLSRHTLPWLEGEGAILNRTWSVDDYLREASKGEKHGYRIVKAVYIEVDRAHNERESENEEIVRVVRGGKTPLRGACISGDLTSEGFAEYIRRWAKEPEVRGVRQVLHVPSAKPGTCLEEQFVSNVRLLGSLGLVFEGCVRNPELGDLVKLAKMCPDTTIVLDHMGIVDADVMAKTNPTPDERTYQENHIAHMRELGALGNVVCKVSGLNPMKEWDVSSLARSVDVALESFPADRVMFASNFPVLNVAMSLDQWICSMLKITEGMPAEQREALFSKNACRVYGI